MNLSDYKAGAYQQQYRYRSFLPSTLCHPWVVSDPNLMILLSEADRALGELNAFAQLIPDIDFFIQMHVAKEATKSSRIEGTQTNIQDAFKASTDVLPDRRDDWFEVQNYIRAITVAIARLSELPFSNRLLRDTHHILMQGARGEHKQPGEFRTSQNWIGVSLEKAAFIPPHHDLVPDLMADLEEFLHSDSVLLPPLIKIAIAHYQFETIHPFLDGNGRLGRLMVSLYLASSGLLAKPALYLSDFLERNKTAYIDHLMAVRDANHMSAWVGFFLIGVKETASSSSNTLKRVLDMKGRIERETLPRFSARRQQNAQKLIRHLYGKPIIDVKEATALLNTTPNTASDLISDFSAYGVLSEITGQRRNRLFLFEEYFRLFE